MVQSSAAAYPEVSDERRERQDAVRLRLGLGRGALEESGRAELDGSNEARERLLLTGRARLGHGLGPALARETSAGDCRT